MDERVGEGFRLIDDLTIWDSTSSEGQLVVGSITADKYLLVPKAQAAAFRTALDGLRAGDPPEVVQGKVATMGFDLEVPRFCDLLYYKRLASREGRWFDGKETGDSLSRVQSEMLAFSLPLATVAIRKHLVSPKAARFVPGILASLASASTLGVLAAALLVHPDRVASFISMSRSLRVGVGLILPFAALLFTFMVLSIGLHEMGHVLMARRYGLFLRTVKIRLYWFTQTYISVQIPGLCTLPPRANNLVSVAGPLMNLILANCLTMAFFLLPSIPVLSATLAGMGAGNYFMTLGNLNPFFPTDGYKFISVAVFHHPDIRTSVGTAIRNRAFAKMSRRQWAYLAMYLLSIGVSFAVLELSGMGLQRLLAAHLPVWLSWLISGALLAAGNVALIVRMYKYLSGKQKVKGT